MNSDIIRNELDEFAQVATQCRAESVDRLQCRVIRRARSNSLDGRPSQTGPRGKFGIGDIFASPPFIGAHGFTEFDDNHLTALR